MRTAAPTLLLLALCACGAPRPVTPSGVTVLTAPELPPPPAAVEAAQKALAQAGTYAGPVDGELTPSTRVAIVQLQRARGIPVSGELDAATMQALSLPPVETFRHQTTEGPEQRTAQPEGPTARELLDDGVRPLPQPPAGAIEGALAQARSVLDDADAAAREALAAQDGTLAERTAKAQEILREARSRAFDAVREARAQGGFALLPPVLIGRLEDALAQRALLVRGKDGALGPDDAAAIRWLQRSLGMEPTGQPTVPLLEALGIDPAPMFQAP